MKKSLLLMSLLVAGLSGAAVASDGDNAVKRGEAKAFYCTGCHGYNGMGTQAVVELAGKDKTELLNKLIEAKNKKSSIMGPVLAKFSASDLDDLASYFASLKKTGSGIASFARDIKPIIEWRCLSCHTPEGEGMRKSGLNLSSYAALMEGTKEGGELIVPGDATASSFMVMVTRKDHLRMPFGAPPLADDEIRVLRTWIDQGAKNN